MRHPGRDRVGSRASAISAGMRWASTITTIGLEMALPPLAGAWLDQQLGTSPWLVVILAVLGFLVAMMHLWQLVRRLESQNARSKKAGRGGSES